MSRFYKNQHILIKNGFEYGEGIITTINKESVEADIIFKQGVVQSISFSTRDATMKETPVLELTKWEYTND